LAVTGNINVCSNISFSVRLNWFSSSWNYRLCKKLHSVTNFLQQKCSMCVDVHCAALWT